jgi:hypothetical protein
MNAGNTFYKPEFLMLFAVLQFFACCKKPANQNFQINYQYSYYPIDSGHYIIYNVDSVAFDYDGINYNRDTVQYQMMAVFGDTIHDLLDSVNFLVTYYTRPNASAQWGSPYISYGLRTQTNLQVVENDIRFIKMVFPPQLNETWNGNLYVPIDNNPNSAYTIFENWNYYYENIDTDMVLNGLTYNKTIEVSEVNSINQLTKEVRTEIYAQNVGLIYEEWESLSKENGIYGNLSLGFDTGAATGFSIHMWAIAHYP